jgi:hypothetical protein
MVQRGYTFLPEAPYTENQVATPPVTGKDTVGRASYPAEPQVRPPDPGRGYSSGGIVNLPPESQLSAQQSSRGYSAYQEAGGSHSTSYQRALTACALVLAILPIPVTALGLLPVYRLQALFLLFYAPLVCLLILAYLYYVRASLARLMFADLLRPQVRRDPYYRPNFEQSLARIGARLRAAVLALLPLICLSLSFYCFTRYAARLNDSVDIAVVDQMQSGGATTTAAATSAGEKPQVPPSDRVAKGRQDAAAAEQAQAKGASLASPDPRVLRQRVLQELGIDDIPLFRELTILYIGAFAAALVALILMALKEYAKTAMGLSERDMVLGQVATDQEQF